MLKVWEKATTKEAKLFWTNQRRPPFQPLNNANGNEISSDGQVTGITGTASNTGGNVDYYPPYYVLAFIMKL